MKHEERAEDVTAADGGVRVMAPESFTLRLAPFALNCDAETAPGATTMLPVSLAGGFRPHLQDFAAPPYPLP